MVQVLQQAARDEHREMQQLHGSNRISACKKNCNLWARCNHYWVPDTSSCFGGLNKQLQSPSGP